MERGKNVRSPSLVGGTDYIMKTWAKAPTFEQVRFVNFESNGAASANPTKQLKDMLEGDVYNFRLGRKPFTGIMQDNCLVHGESKIRITFFEMLNSTTAVDAPAEGAETVQAEKGMAPDAATESSEEAVQAESNTDEQAAENNAEEPALAEASDESTETVDEPEAEPVEIEAAPAEETVQDNAESTVSEETVSDDAQTSAEASSDDHAEPAEHGSDEHPDESPADRKRRLDAQRKREARAAARAAQAQGSTEASVL